MSDEWGGTGESKDSDGFSLESILAEIKGTAFINGDKKTPSDVLQEKADRILREAAEATALAAQQTSTSTAPQTISSATNQTSSYQIPQGVVADAEAIRAGESRAALEPEFTDTDEIPMIVTPIADEVAVERSESSFMSFDAAMDEASLMSAKASNTGTTDSPAFVIPIRDDEQSASQNTQQVVYFDQYRTDDTQTQNQDTMVHDINDTDTKEAEDTEQKGKSGWGFGKRSRTILFDQEVSSEGIFGEEAEPEPVPEEVFEEPPLRNAVKRFAADSNSIVLRVIPASVITLIMVLITFVFEAGMVVPFGIGHNLNYAAGTLMLFLLFVMMLCSDVIVRGVDFLIRGAPNAETLILFSCVFSLISATFTMISGVAAMLPFCAVSALSLTLATHGEKYNLRAITDTLKTAVGSSTPFGVQAEYNANIDKSVLKKTFSRTDGFYNNIMQPDISEVLYRYAAPALLIGSLLLTILIVAVRGAVENSLHILSALLAAAAPFSALLSYSIPFFTVAKTTRKSGAAIAGWGGADDICFTDGVCVTDDDLFPPGMLRLSGVKVYDGASPENAIRYTASLVRSSGSGLTGLFTEVLKQQGMSPMRVENFECHESGIGGIINGVQVSTGSAAYMNLLGVRVPDDASMKNAVYTAINSRLVAMFAIDYKPLPSVQSALISMLKWRIDLYFAMRDFNVTPAMVGQKFKVPFDSFVFIPAKDSYTISDLHSEKPGRMAAVLVREGLNPYAEAITGGRLLKSASFFATILSIVSAVLGVVIMFYMCWTGSFLSASPGNLIIFMLSMLATVLIVCGYVKLKQ